MQFDVELNGEFDFSKCRRFAVRGYNKAKLFSSLSVDIKDCQAFNPILIRPKDVLDAVGKSVTDKGIALSLSLSLSLYVCVCIVSIKSRFVIKL